MVLYRVPRAPIRFVMSSVAAADVRQAIAGFIVGFVLDIALFVR